MKQDNFKFPKPPGLDLNDPKTLSGAKAVATRKNNAFKKMVAEKLPLFAEEMFSEYETVTPEIVIASRKLEREGWAIKWREIRALERKHCRQFRAEVQALSADETEFFFFIRMRVRMRGGSRSMKWSRVLSLIKRRLEKPLSKNADLVLAWLQQEVKPVTHFEIWERRGDGLTPQQILIALMELMQFAYADSIDCVKIPEKYTDLPDWKSNTAWTWEAIKTK